MADWFYQNCWNSNSTGFFVEIGAYDGLKMNSTKRLENLNWNGVCVEALPDRFEILKKNRSCSCINAVVYNYDGIVDFGIVLDKPGWDGILTNLNSETLKKKIQSITLPCLTWDSLGLPIKINYLQIDVEGSEQQILDTIDFKKYDIDYICLEDSKANLNNGESDYLEFMKSKNYKIVFQCWADTLYKKI
jgi:FkbM family methyltransferase